MPSFIPATGRTQHVADVWVNRIGKVWSNRDKRTLLDKMLGLLDILAIKVPFYFVADAYECAARFSRWRGAQPQLAINKRPRIPLRPDLPHPNTAAR